jgi:hypothetical protein
LVVNAITLWNTIYLGEATAELARRGVMTDPEDAARLSPLIHGHINFLGRYSFTLPKEIKRGGLRPLRSLRGYHAV